MRIQTYSGQTQTRKFKLKNAKRKDGFQHEMKNAPDGQTWPFHHWQPRGRISPLPLRLMLRLRICLSCFAWDKVVVPSWCCFCFFLKTTIRQIWGGKRQIVGWDYKFGVHYRAFPPTHPATHRLLELEDVTFKDLIEFQLKQTFKTDG